MKLYLIYRAMKTYFGQYQFMTKLYCRIDDNKEYEFYHLCSENKLYSIYHKEKTRYPNKCPRCFFQIPSVYLMGGNNVETHILGSSSTLRRGLLNGIRLDQGLKLKLHELPIL